MTIERTDLPTGGISRKLLDTINAVLAVWLFISPWVLVYGTGDAWNTWIVSAIIFLVSLSALSRPSVWQERVNLVLGAWLFISPWVLAFSNPSMGASWNQWLCGAVVFLISAYCMAARRGISGPGMEHFRGAH